MHKVLYFLGGVVVGCTATYFIINKKVEKRIQEEVNCVKERYSKDKVLGAIKEKQESALGFSFKVVTDPKSKVEELNQRKADMVSYDKISKSQNYNHNLFTNPPNPGDIDNGIDDNENLEYEYGKVIDTTPPKEGLSDPYTITPDQFVNEQPFFDKITLEYYDDDVLCEEITDEIVTDISGEVGLESLTKFGEYEEDVVYVRNEKRSTDYEIIRQHRKFANIPKDENY